ncbi:hypothetical protein E2C01_018888 [Portunus trituberculatus]|uniref:Uncharacterized protein n=1 Tax=Portunus trituberculatus TaxID=210409 RepID=A0A5B7DWU3_PORTR|nr:hypothetical protein [Portunus trituberculatus]
MDNTKKHFAPRISVGQRNVEDSSRDGGVCLTRVTRVWCCGDAQRRHDNCGNNPARWMMPATLACADVCWTRLHPSPLTPHPCLQSWCSTSTNHL